MMKGDKMKKLLAILACMSIMCGCAAQNAGNAESSPQETAAPAESTAADTEASVRTTEDAAQETTESTETAEEQKEEEKSMERFASLITELPPEGYDRKEEGVVYPEFQKYTYYSSTVERESRVNVLMPADAQEGETFPVLYILHGFWDNEDWMTRDNVAISRILTNLQNEGKAERMIVVLPYIYCSKDNPYCTAMDLENSLAYDNFINDLQTDLIPFITENFPVKEGRENRAVTGFSMGGRESLFIATQMSDYFGYVGACCPAPGLVTIPGSPMHPGQITPAELSFPENKPLALLISYSKADGVVGSSPASYVDILEQNGEEHLVHVMESTGHDPTSVKPHIYNYLQMLFR